MDSIRIAGTLEGNATQETQASRPAREPSASEIRTLGEVELALVAGGEGIPCWP